MCYFPKFFRRTKLPSETWLDILRCLDRFSLDRAEFTCRQFRSLVDGHNEELAIRAFHSATLARKHAGCNRYYYDYCLSPASFDDFDRIQGNSKQLGKAAMEILPYLRDCVVLNNFTFFGIQFGPPLLALLRTHCATCKVTGTLELKGTYGSSLTVETSPSVFHVFQKVEAVSTNWLCRAVIDLCLERGLEYVYNQIAPSQIGEYCFEERDNPVSKRRLRVDEPRCYTQDFIEALRQVCLGTKRREC